MTTDATVRVYVPGLFTEPAEDTHTALMYTSVGLREHERWTQHVLYVQDRRAPDPNDPFSGNWCACMLGMLYVCTTGVIRAPDNVWDRARYFDNVPGAKLYVAAARHLVEKVRSFVTNPTGQTIDGVTFNDAPGRSLAQVLTVVDQAVAATEPARNEEITTE